MANVSFNSCFNPKQLYKKYFSDQIKLLLKQ